MLRVLRILLISAFFLFSLYPPAELTRYIIAYTDYYGFEPGMKFEIWWIWIGWTGMMILFSLILWTNIEDLKK